MGLSQQALLQLGPPKANRGAEIEASIEAIVRKAKGYARQGLHPQSCGGKGQPTLALRRGAGSQKQPPERRGEAKAGQGRDERMHEAQLASPPPKVSSRARRMRPSEPVSSKTLRRSR